MRARSFALLALLVSLPACGDGNLAGEGKPCSTSAECADGLVCDYGKSPPVCASMLTVSRDMAVNVKDGGARDLSMQPPTDGP